MDKGREFIGSRKRPRESVARALGACPASDFENFTGRTKFNLFTSIQPNNGISFDAFICLI